VGSNDSERRPIVGLTTYVETARFGPWEERAALVPDTYIQAVHAAGGLPVLFPPALPADAGVIAGVDALILTGGPDVDPARYGAVAHAETGAPRTERDEWELALCRLSLEADLPMLAICRGVQVLNVALGGTLHQHLPDVVGHSGHRPATGATGMTEVVVDAGSLTGSLLGSQATVVCSHHQALDVLGDGLAVVARSLDETIEAVEVAGRSFAVGVQWHPEDDPTDRRIFVGLVGAARRSILTGGHRP